MKPVAITPFDRTTTNAAAEIMFGAFVKRSAEGTAIECVNAADSLGYLGVAEESKTQLDKDGFYSTYDVVPVITAGRVNVWVEGGGTDITAGMFLKLNEDEGFLEYDSTTRSISTSVCKALEDAEISDYTTGLTTGTAGSKTVTVTSTSNMAVDGYVYLDSGTDTTSEVVVVDSIDSSTQFTAKVALANSYSSKDAQIMIQVEALLL